MLLTLEHFWMSGWSRLIDAIDDYFSPYRAVLIEQPATMNMVTQDFAAALDSPRPTATLEQDQYRSSVLVVQPLARLEIV